MNKTMKIFGTLLACLALAGTCLAAPRGGHSNYRRHAPVHHEAPRRHHHAPPPVVHHHHGHHHGSTGVIAIGAALVGGLIGGLIGR